MDPTIPRRHIFIPGAAEPRDYQRPRRDMSELAGPSVPADRRAHGRGLQQALEAVPDRHRALVEATDLDPDDIAGAYYLTFRIDSLADFDIGTLAPYANTSGIRILATHELRNEQGVITYEVTVFVPASQLTRFQQKVAQYLNTIANDSPRLSAQIDRWQSVDLASIRQFWTDRSPFPSDNESIWWEVWLRYEEGDQSPVTNLRSYCERFDISLADKALVIDDRVVTLARATPTQWSAAPLVLAYLAEFRRARELATPFLEMPNREQRQWAEDLADRILQIGANMPAVCVVDSGVNRAHALLEASLAAGDQHTCEQAWGVDDVADIAFIGHGTGMAGLALLGQDLPDLHLSQDEIEIRHKLESVKILPRAGGNAPELYGVRVVEATTGPESVAPTRRRVYLLALTARNSESSGEPSLWAATIDSLSVGRSIYPDASTESLEQLTDHPDPTDTRLWILSTGNVRDGHTDDHLTVSDNHTIESPAEAWNALAVGAMTDSCEIRNPLERERALVRVRGELSPFSRTSGQFDPDRPIKPEIVMEGGNASVDGDGNVAFGHGDLSLLTTSHDLLNQHYIEFFGTSAASALAARMAARILADYPHLWPETVRGLLVHSARWTPAMQQRFAPLRTKAERLALLRRYGWGVPDEQQALRSLGHRLTLVCEDEFQPFTEGKYHRMCLHHLPWPVEALQDIGEEDVRLRVTLSTFVDPHPSRRGRYGYPSHQLRFALKSRDEAPETFVARINQAARDGNYQSAGAPADNRWFFGSDARARGSIFCDVWSGPAADLAGRSELAVIPVSGWWKDRKINQRIRYSLLISIETDRQQADLWQEVVYTVEASGVVVPAE